MSVPPVFLTNSGLWKRITNHPEFVSTLTQLRSVAEELSSRIQQTLPEFTDHSVKHCDSLWVVTDSVLTPAEMTQLSPSEAFLLGCSYYVHDLGMALAATEQGKERLRSSGTYKSHLARLVASKVSDPAAGVLALRLAAREQHAEEALRLVTEPLPGISRYLIEQSDVRDNWCNNIGQISASHNWSLDEIENHLGRRDRIPVPSGSSVDLAYLACILRVVDYAHINGDRASVLARMLRSPLYVESAWHWEAQQNISGPVREASLLVYSNTKPHTSPDAWWTFFELVTGLNREIALVNEYLRGRSASQGRFSLEGVKSIESPQSFARLVSTSGFEPIDVRFHPSSLERLIRMLGGRALYGDDFSVPLRELIQNSVDAIVLQQSRLQGNDGGAYAGQINVSLEHTGDLWELVVRDNGAGMSSNVVTNYLLGVASDYWHSTDFFRDFPDANSRGFSPIGKFGIGFLSVFMISDALEVVTQRTNGERLCLKLDGLGHRGSLQRETPLLYAGTTVRLRLIKDHYFKFQHLYQLVLRKCPMATVRTTITDQESNSLTIEPGWWKTVKQDDFVDFVLCCSNMSRRRFDQESDWEEVRDLLTGLAVNGKQPWPWSSGTPEVVSDRHRLVASAEHGTVVLCSKGFMITSITVQGIVGLVELGDVDTNAARSFVRSLPVNEMANRWRTELREPIISALNMLDESENIPSLLNGIIKVCECHGNNILDETTLRWVTVIERPGTVNLRSSAEINEMLRHLNLLIVTYGINTWQAFSNSHSLFPEAPLGVPILPIAITGGEPEPGSYKDEHETVPGVLRDHFQQAPYRKFEDAHLLLATIRLIAKAWSVNETALEGQIWKRKNQTLAGYLSRR